MSDHNVEGRERISSSEGRTNAALARALHASLCSIAASAAVCAGAPAVAQERVRDDLEEVMVTGSRILRQDFEAASPVVTI